MFKTTQHNPLLSNHFDLFTMCASETAERLGFLNLPQEDRILRNLEALCTHVLDPLVAYFDLPLNVTSGYRSPQLNTEIGGLAESQHLSGQAADIMMGGLRNDELAKWIIHNVEFDEVILEKFDPDNGEFGWVHVSYNAGENRGQISTFDGKIYHDGLHYLDLGSRD